MSAIESTNVVTANLERMAFAHARGARFQSRNRYGNWVNKSSVFIPIRGDRIHPSDEHLQYGPLSSALIEFAKTGKSTILAARALDIAADISSDNSLFALFETDEVERRMHCAFVAEFLADEGL